MMHRKIRYSTQRLIYAAIILFCFSTIAKAVIPDDSYIAGYAAGVLKSHFNIEIPSLVVTNGVISVPANDLDIEYHISVLQLLSEVPGVTAVELLETTDQPASVTSAATSASDEPSKPASISANESALYPTGLLPTGHLFKPLLADPRWAHFSAAYRNYVGANVDGNHNGSVSFGETIPFYRANLGQTTIQWETGIQATVFSDFNLGAESADLLNHYRLAPVGSFLTGSR